MKKLLNPRWLFLINTLPVIILFFVGWSEYNIIDSLLKEENISLWKSFSIALIILAVLNAGYAIVQILRRKPIDPVYCVVSLIAYITFIVSYFEYYSDIIPFSIPDWMISGNIFIYVGAFLMPTLAHSLLCLVVMLTHYPKRDSAWKNLFIAIAIPVLVYALAIIVAPLWNGAVFSDMVFTVGIILTTVLFLFFLLRFIYILITKKNIYKQNQLFWKIPITFVLPVIGLMTNDYVFSHVFGDFSGIWYYLITLLNAALLCVPSPKDSKLRLLLFAGRCITFVYTLYFFLVFLPVLPLSLIAVIIFGAGFLMLAPLALFPVHISELAKDYDILKHFYKKRIIYLTATVGLLVLPVSVTISYLNDRKALHETLEYLYSPDYSKEYKLKSASINRVLDITDRRVGMDMFMYSSTPYLSSYYKWLVLDNLTISNDKRRMMHRIFDGDHRAEILDSTGAGNTRKPDINISGITHNSRYDTQQQAWISWVDISITNGNTELWDAEYKTTFELPAGCWISDYYLYVGEVKEPGILAEKKAATWVFNQIRNVNRDPGMLRYLSGNSVEFRVFPFQKDETRLTGIEFIHKEPVQIDIDSHSITLGEASVQAGTDNTVKSDGVIYLSASDKDKLETVERTPYYHFVVDMSTNNDEGSYTFIGEPKKPYKDKEKAERYIRQINRLLDRNLIAGSDAKITFTNINTKTMALNDNWTDAIRDMKFEGGFYLDRAIKEILYDTYTNPQSKYPVIVVVSDFPNKGVINEDIADFHFVYPESELFYSLSANILKSHSFAKGIRTVIVNHVDTIPKHTVKAYPDAVNPTDYLPNDGKASILLTTKDKTLNVTTDDIEKKSWTSGLQMQAQWMLQTLYPQTADKEWLPLVQNSFKSGIMSPHTSYIVVENEAQKAILMKKQEETLNGHRALDLDDNTQPMSEPDMLIIIVLFAVFYLLYKRRKKKRAIV